MESPRLLSLFLFSAVAMCYGWGWRGSYGHEAGAMVPGALVAMAVCLGSARPGWYRRCAVAGLCGAIGWAWGGTLTNMEHRLYILSDTPVDVVYGFACIGLVGLLWSGIGGAILALAFTRPRSELNRFIGPLTVVGTAFLLTYLYFFFRPAAFEAYAAYTEEEWHDGEWLAALTIPIVLVPYWFIRRGDRPATRLILECTAAWWIGYLALTKFGGIELAPPYRSEVWAGVIGILVALLLHHWRQRDRAAVVFTAYAMLAGCIGFILALQIHVPFATGWGYFAPLSAWKHAEESFGFFMGFGVAMGAGRLIQGNLEPPSEDVDRRRLDVFAGFVLVVVMSWMNLKKNAWHWRVRSDVLPAEPLAYFKEPFPQFEPWAYFLIAGILWTLPVLYGLRLYRRGSLALAPASAYGKGALLFLVVTGVSLAAVIAKRVADYKNPSAMMSGFSFLALAAIATWMLIARSGDALRAREPTAAPKSAADPSWKLGWRYWAVWAWVPLHICIASAIALKIEDGPWRREDGKERHRFGPDATWRREAEKQASRVDHLRIQVSPNEAGVSVRYEEARQPAGS